MKARTVLKEMCDSTSLDLIDKHLVTDSIAISIGYSKDIISPTNAHIKLPVRTNTYSILLKYFLEIYDKKTSKSYPIRRISISCNNVLDEAYESYDLFTDVDALRNERKVETVINNIKNKYGKNIIIKGMDKLDYATTIKRNKLIGGHNAE